MSSFTIAGIEESINEAFQEAKRDNNERAKIRAELAQAQGLVLLVERMDELLRHLRRWDCGDQLAVSLRDGHEHDSTEIMRGTRTGTKP